MANFETALQAIREGKRVRQAGWPGWISASGGGMVSVERLLAADWEVLPDPEPEPQWLLLEPGMTIREGDEVLLESGFRPTTRCNEKVGEANTYLYRRRIEVAK